MSLRVIAGSAKGRRLKLVPGDSTRPIMDKAKEALFSILGFNIVDAMFLDLFAGTGSVGIEALSRGAKQATFFDLERQAIKTIHENLRTTKLDNHAIVRMMDALTYLERKGDDYYDFIYIAPPQYKKLWIESLKRIDNNIDMLAEDGVVIVQIDPKEDEPIALTNLCEYDRRRYGRTLFIFYAACEDLDTNTEGDNNHAESR
jgi:16S rRNA (guanine966-N2)-methyltransferase